MQAFVLVQTYCSTKIRWGVQPIAIGECLRHLTAKCIFLKNETIFQGSLCLHNMVSLHKVAQSSWDIIGSLEKALASLDELNSSFSSVGLKVAESKFEVFYLSNESAQEVSKVTCIPTTSMGTKILGLPIGGIVSLLFLLLVWRMTESGKVLCNELALLSDSESALLLLRHCLGTPLLNICQDQCLQCY